VSLRWESAPADEIEFVTLPEVVRSTVVRETQIPDYTRVRRVVRQDDGIYEVTVQRDDDDYVVDQEIYRDVETGEKVKVKREIDE
jgi:hypothetical protein